MNIRDYAVATVCRGCLETFKVFVTEEDYNDWLQGRKHIQDAFPYLDVDERELLISNTCSKCWEEMFPEEEEDFDLGYDDMFYPESEDPTYDRDWYVD